MTVVEVGYSLVGSCYFLKFCEAGDLQHPFNPSWPLGRSAVAIQGYLWYSCYAILQSVEILLRVLLAGKYLLKPVISERWINDTGNFQNLVRQVTKKFIQLGGLNLDSMTTKPLTPCFLRVCLCVDVFMHSSIHTSIHFYKKKTIFSRESKILFCKYNRSNGI